MAVTYTFSSASYKADERIEQALAAGHEIVQLGEQDGVITYQEVRYRGAVLCDRERNYHDDSDFYAICWSERKQCLVYEEFDTTRFAGGGACRVDATEEVKAKAAAWNAQQILRQHLWDWAASKARDLVAGRRVVLLKPIRRKRDNKLVTVREQGVEAQLTCRTPGKAFRPVFNEWAKPLDRVKLVFDDGGEEWIDCDDTRMAVVEPELYLPDYADLEAMAAGKATIWHLLWSAGSGLLVI